MSRYDDDYEDEIEDEEDEFDDEDEELDEDEDESPRRSSVNPFSSGAKPSPFSSGAAPGSRPGDSSRLPGNPAQSGGARPGGNNPPFQRPSPPGGPGGSGSNAPGGSSPFSRPGSPPPPPGGSGSNPPGGNRPSPFGSNPPQRPPAGDAGDKKDDKPGGLGARPSSFSKPDDKKDDKPGGLGARPSPFGAKPDDKKDDRPGGLGARPSPFGAKPDEKKDDKPGGGLAGKLPFGGSKDPKDAKKDDKPSGGLAGKLPSFGGSKDPKDAKKDDKPGGGFASKLPSFGGGKSDEKKDDKSGGGFASKLPSFGGNKDPKDAKKDDKPGGGGFASKLPSFGGNKDGGDKPAAPKSTGEMPKAGGGGFGGLGARPSDPPKPGGSSAQSPFGSRVSGGAPGDKPATPKSAAAKAPRMSLGERIKGFSLFKKQEAKPGTKARASKAPTVRRDGLSLDTKLDILGVALVLGSLMMIFSSLSPTQGQLTGTINGFLSTNLGWGALAVPIVMFGAGVWLILRHFGEEAPILDTMRVVGLGVLYIGALVLFQYGDSFTYDLRGASDPMERLRLYLQVSQLYGRGGGWVGAEIYFFLVTQFTEIGGFFVLLAWLVVGIMLTLSLSAAELAIIVISVWRSFSDARKRRVQRRTAQAAERAAAAAALPQIAVSKPVPEPLPAVKAAPALPTPIAASIMPPEPIEEARSIPITQGGRTVTASFTPGEPVRVEPVPVETSAPERRTSLFPPRSEPVPAGATPSDGQGASGGSRFGGIAARLRGGKADDATPAAPKEAKSESDGVKPAHVVGGLIGGALLKVKDAMPAGKGDKPVEGKPAANPVLASTAPVEAVVEKPADEKSVRFGSLLGGRNKDGADKPAAPARPSLFGRSSAPGEGSEKPAAPAPIDAPAASNGERPSPFGKPAAAETPLREEAPATPVRPSPSGRPAPADGDGNGDKPATEERRSPFGAPAASTSTGERPSPFGKPAEPRTPAAEGSGSPLSPRPSPFGRPPEPAKPETTTHEVTAAAASSADAPAASLAGTTSPDAPRTDRFKTGERPSPFRANVPPPVSAAKPSLPKDEPDEDDELPDDIDPTVLQPAKPKGILSKPPEPPARPSPFNKPPTREMATPMASSPKPSFGSLQDRLSMLRSRETAEDSKADDAIPAASAAEAKPADALPITEKPTTEAPAVTPPAPQAPPRRVAPWEDEPAADAKAAPPVPMPDAKPAAPAPVQPAASVAPREERPAPRIVSMEEDEIRAQLKTSALQADDEDDVPEARMPTMTDSRPSGLRPSGMTGSTPARDAAHRMPEAPTPPPPPARGTAFTPPNPPGVPNTPPPPPQAGGRARKEYQLPDYHALLSAGSDQELNHDVLIARAKMIEETLASFGAPGRVVEVRTGPVITQFGVEPDYLPGRGGKKIRVKVSAIAALDKDLQLALGAKSIRIEAPVPGKGYVGIEVPNEKPAVVRLRDVLESQEFRKINSPLAICLGQGVDGTPVAADLGTMPHLLIAGTTGSGKSVCVNAIIASLLVKNTPDKLKFIMVDPKRVELTGYNGIPHLVAPVVVELERIVGVLKWVTREMDERYKRFSSAGARNIEDFNKHRPASEQHMPYIIVIIDELADLMMLAPDETERVITRIAALARATGIHLVIATQRPSVDVVTGLIKANFPARIAFAVASGMDSRVILDQPGADRLLGRGDMLYMSGDSPAPLRLQGVFVSDDEINNLTRAWRTQMDAEDLAARPSLSAFMSDESAPASVSSGWGSAPASGRSGGSTSQRPPSQQVAFWDRELSSGANDHDDADDVSDGEDAMYETAVDLVRRQNKASVSLLQRRLRIGYTRAARLMDIMEERGVVGPPVEGSKPREVLPIKR